MSTTQITHPDLLTTRTERADACDVADDVHPAPFAPVAAVRHIASGVAA